MKDSPRTPAIVSSPARFTLKSVSAVAVGALNTSIIHPAWLTEIGLLESDAEVKINLNLSQPGLVLEGGKGNESFGKWLIRADRLVVTTTEWEARPGDQVAQVLRELPWTPVVAVGLNFAFVPHDATTDIVFPEGFPGDVKTTDSIVAERTWHVKFRSDTDETERNVQITKRHDATPVVELNVNYHTNTEKIDTHDITRILETFGKSMDKTHRLVWETTGWEVQ